MCGVAALFSYRSPEPPDPHRLRAMRERMQPRGPDGFGNWISPGGEVGLAHRRLSILDLSERGSQPMGSEDGSLVISYNGEIFNFPHLRRRLEDQGHRFRTGTDTEVLLALYSQFGEGMLGHLRGMFAFALWDQDRQALLIARDPFGIKPLYFSDDGRTFAVASEVKALLAGGRVDTTANPAGQTGFFLFGYVPEPHTLVRGIRALPAGSCLWVTRDAGVGIPRVFEQLGQLEAQSPRVPAPDELGAAIASSVGDHLLADVDVGVFLSSGLDSVSVAAAASRRGGRLRTVTLGFQEFRGTPHDETPLAQLVAERLGTEHRTVWITREDYRAEQDAFFDRMDQPTIDGLNTYFVALAARRAGLKVALSGLGGDELLGGYDGFRQIPRIMGAMRLLPHGGSVARALRTVTAPWIGRFTSPKWAGLLEFGGTLGGAYLLRRSLFMPWELPRILDRDLVREGLESLDLDSSLNAVLEPEGGVRARVSVLEASHYMRCQLLRDADWAGMSHSVEIRVPLVDLGLWRMVAKAGMLGQQGGKAAMALGCWPDIPQQILRRQKTGFAVPVRDWMQDGLGQRGLRGWARQVYATYCEAADVAPGWNAAM